MSSNTGKWKVYSNAAVLYGPSGSGQNLNDDLEKSIGDEADTVLDDLLGADMVLAGLLVQTSTGLAVAVTAGVGYVSGQRVRQTIAGLVTLLPANTSSIKIYVQAGTPFVLANRAWPAVFGFTTGALGTDQMLLATIATDGTGTTAIVDGRALMPQMTNSPTAAEKAALAGTGVTAPSGSNKFVADDDARLQGGLLTVATPQTVTAVHTFNPTIAGPPFVLGPNAQNQKVPGLDADKVDGADITSLRDAASLTGTLSDARLPASVPLLPLGNVFTAPQTIQTAGVAPPIILGLNNRGQKVDGWNADLLDGMEASALLNAANLTGTLPDARLSANVWQKSNDPKHAVRAFHSAIQTVTNDGAYHTLALDSERYDPDGMHSLIPGSTFRIIIQTLGQYLITANVRFEVNATGTFRGMRVLLNSANPIAPYIQMSVAGGGGDYLNGAMLMRFNAGDTLELQVAHNASTNLNVISNPQVSPELAVQWMGA